MQSRHQQKFAINLLIGLILTTAGIIAFSYILKKQPVTELFMWSLVVAVVFNLGLLFLGSAMIHKVKADIKKRQKKKDDE